MQIVAIVSKQSLPYIHEFNLFKTLPFQPPFHLLGFFSPKDLT